MGRRLARLSSIACTSHDMKLLETAVRANKSLGRGSHATERRQITTIRKTSFTVKDCCGDYRSDTEFEGTNQPLYALQKSLPRLPVPTLDATIECFLQSALPLAKSNEEVDNLLAAAKVFPQEASHLQTRLLRRSTEYHNSSWLQHWWNEQIYLQCRDPLFFISFFYRLQHDDSCLSDGLARAAAAVQSVALLARNVCSGSKEPDYVRRGHERTPLCSTQYKYLFHSCRIPQPKQDSYRIYSPKPLQRPYVAVATRGQFYKVYVDDSNGRPYSRDALKGALQQCRRFSLERKEMVPELGWLTATHRDRWSEVYQFMNQSTTELALALQELQGAMFVLCLDENDDQLLLNASQHASQIWHGNIFNSANRWMDKSLQITVNNTGGLGCVGEHAMMDGMPAMLVCHTMMKQGRVDSGEPADIQISDTCPEIPTNIFAAAFATLEPSLKNEIETCIQAAQEEVIGLIQQYELDVLTFRQYGSHEIKKTDCAPDAFVQMAIQLAGYRLFGEQVATYEATQMRAFLHGRTETTRGVSLASASFVKGLCSEKTTEVQKLELMVEACRVHTETTRKASSGNGIDRHFYGLLNLVRDGEPTPSLFDNELFRQSKRWRLSTSTVPGVQCGFCCVDDDGLGIGYDIKSHECVFTVVARRDRKLALRATKLLSEALDEMMRLARVPSLPASKL